MLRIENLRVDSSVGAEVFKERDVVINSGEHVLISGAPGEGKTPLFRALAGLWPWGSGRITFPRGEQILYLPRGTPYLPRGTLREVLAYPLKVDEFEASRYTLALGQLGIARLATSLDETHRWDRELNQDEQLSVALARIVLHAPPWVLLDDTFTSLDDETLERVVDIFTHSLQKTTVIHIGRTALMHLPLFSRVVHVMKAPASPAGAKGGATESTASAVKEPVRNTR